MVILQAEKLLMIMKRYLKSKHKWTYIWLAIKHRTTPTHVFNLAHNIEEMHGKDRPIMHDLKVKGIIHSHKSRGHKG